MRRSVVRPSWVQMAEWIAFNDNPSELDLEAIKGSVTVCMVHDLTGIDEQNIATRIRSRRYERDYWAKDPVQHLGGQA